MPTLLQGIETHNGEDAHPKEYVFVLNDSFPVSLNIIKAVAKIEDIPACDVGNVLHDYIDPDSIDRLYELQTEKRHKDVELEFSFGRYRIMLNCSTLTLKQYDPPD